jgi:hypothetical protein
VPVLLGALFDGLHSTLFGPVKFAYMPQVLSERELTGGNGMVEMGTFVAILLGRWRVACWWPCLSIGAHQCGLGCVLVAVLGRLVAQFIPASRRPTPPAHQLEPGDRDLAQPGWRISNVVVFRSLLGISWMWFFGAVFLSQFPSLAKEVLHGNEQVASLLLVVFSIGIGTGSLLCEVLSAPPCRDWPGAAGRHRHERVCGRSVLCATRSLPPPR